MSRSGSAGGSSYCPVITDHSGLPLSTIENYQKRLPWSCINSIVSPLFAAFGKKKQKTHTHNKRLSSSFLLQLAVFLNNFFALFFYWILKSFGLPNVRLLCFHWLWPSTVVKQRLFFGDGCAKALSATSVCTCGSNTHTLLYIAPCKPSTVWWTRDPPPRSLLRCHGNSGTFGIARTEVSFLLLLVSSFFSSVWLKAAKYLRALPCWELFFFFLLFSAEKTLRVFCAKEVQGHKGGVFKANEVTEE